MMIENSTNELLTYLKNLPANAIEEVTCIELISNNQVYLNYDVSIYEISKKINKSLPNTNVEVSKGISRVRIENDNNTIIRIQHSCGISFDDGSKFLLSPFEANGLEIILLKISDKKRGIGLGAILLELIIAELSVQLLYVPKLVIRYNNKVELPKEQLELFEKYKFREVENCSTSEIVLVRKEEQLY